jgi:hypothetical protein
MGNNNHVVVNHKHRGFQGHMAGRVVMMEPVVAALRFRSPSSHVFSKAPQNVRVDRSVRRKKFTENNPLHTEEKTSMLFVELRTCRASFALGDCGLFHYDDCCFVSES